MTVKELRKEKNLSQAALAKELGIATSAVGHMENGRMKVSAKTAAKATEVFGVDLADAAEKAAPVAKKTAAKKPAVKETEAKKAAA
ncbi:MAG: helix-turn-helix transcriptional regulator, partial [Lachnospiraceae bacterium]|nr:helix-turn-helix transcriptional regulator [Lachnospiraceae bacterium]